MYPGGREHAQNVWDSRFSPNTGAHTHTPFKSSKII